MRAYHSQHGEEDDGGQAGVGGVGAGVDVGVPLLIQLQHAQPGDHVHEGGVWKAAEQRNVSGTSLVISDVFFHQMKLE